MPLNSRVLFSKNSLLDRLLNLQLGEYEKRVPSTRLRTVKCLRPIGPVRGLCRLHSISAASMRCFNQPRISDNGKDLFARGEKKGSSFFVADVRAGFWTAKSLIIESGFTDKGSKWGG